MRHHQSAGSVLCAAAACMALHASVVRRLTGVARATRTHARAEKDRLTRTLVDAQPPGATPSPVTGLHIIDGATGPMLYVVTEKHTSVIDLTTNQLVSSVPFESSAAVYVCSGVDAWLPASHAPVFSCTAEASELLRVCPADSWPLAHPGSPPTLCRGKALPVSTSTSTLQSIHCGWLGPQTKLDDAGCARGCSAVDESNSLVVARPDAVYFYSTDGRGPCFVHDGACRCATVQLGRTMIAGRPRAWLHSSQAPVCNLTESIVNTGAH